MIQNLEITKGEKRMADGKRRYKSDRKDYKISVKLSEKDMDILKAALKRTGMTASAYIRELIRTGGNIDTSYPEDRAKIIRVIAGIANNVPTTSITINKTNCIIFGIKIDFNLLFNDSVSSRYFTACSSDVVKEPDNSPTFIIFIYIYGNILE